MTGVLGMRRGVRTSANGHRIPLEDNRTPLALVALLVGEGTMADVRVCGLDCELGDIARVAEAMPELSIVLTPEGFRCDLPSGALEEALPRLADGWAGLVLRVVEGLFDLGRYHRVAKVLGGLVDVVDVRSLVFRHVFDLLNAGEVELVESLVFDDAFGAPEWLREALSCAEGLLWVRFRDYRQQVKRAREVQVSLLARAADASRGGEDLIPIAQAWSLLDLYASLGEPVPVASELPPDLVDDGDGLLRCLWTLRRSRQLMALGHLEAALRLLEAAQGLVERDSIIGAQLSLDRFLCRTLGGRRPDEAELRRVRSASRFAGDRGLELLALSIDGYLAAALAYTDASRQGRTIERLVDRSALHPDPILHAALSIGCAAELFRRHSFYAALTYVRDLSANIAYLGSSDLTCCAYGLEAICQGIVGEEPGAPGESNPERPSSLGFLPLARAIYGETQEVFSLVREIDPEGHAVLFEQAEPGYAARVLADLATSGSGAQANALRELIPASWRTVERWGPTDADGNRGPSDRSRHPSLRLVSESGPGREPGAEARLQPESETVPVMPRVHLTSPEVPKVTLHMLGTFQVFLGERRLTDDRWRRKAGKLLLQALVVAPGHTVTRADLCEIIWPDRDFLTSRNHLYSVLSSTRDTFGCRDCKPPYLICEQGKVALNAKLTECDVDVFERRCHDVIAHRGDRSLRLSLCRELTRDYNGGLFVPAQDVRGDFQARRQALESLYMDMLVEATGLALQSGLSKEALWFSNDALNRDELREDVVACHLRALAADGRGRDLEASYKRYCARLSDGLYMAPSVRIRDLHDALARYVQKSAAPGDETIRAYEEALGNVA